MIYLIYFASGITIDTSMSATPIEINAIIGCEDALRFDIMHNEKFEVHSIITFSNSDELKLSITSLSSSPLLIFTKKTSYNTIQPSIDVNSFV